MRATESREGCEGSRAAGPRIESRGCPETINYITAHREPESQFTLHPWETAGIRIENHAAVDSGLIKFESEEKSYREES